MIFTKLHEAIDCAHRGHRVPGKGDSAGKMIECIDAMATVPHYVLDHHLLEALDKKAISKSLTAMMQAGVLRLPFPKLCMELWAGKPGHRLLCYVEETDGDPELMALGIIEWHALERGETLSDIFRCDYRWATKAGPEIEMIWPSKDIYDEDPGAQSGFHVEFVSRAPDQHTQDVVSAAGGGLMLILMMTHLAGLEREKVEPRKLNKHRVASGKRLIPDHSIVRIGHVYNSVGGKVSVTDANRRTMSIHMRAAHTRMQQHGQKWIEENKAAAPTTTDTHHLVLIEAVLVNFKDGSDLSKPLPKLVRY